TRMSSGRDFSDALFACRERRGRHDMHDLHDFSAVHGLQEAVFPGLSCKPCKSCRTFRPCRVYKTMQIMQSMQVMQKKHRKLRVSFAKTALKRPRWPIRPAGGRMETQEALSDSCACVPLSVSPPCGRLASSPTGGAKR